MRIGVNLLYLIPTVVGGTETYARGLLSGLADLPTTHEFIVYVNRAGEKWCRSLPARFSVRVCPVDARSRTLRYAFEQILLPWMARRDRLDVLHSLGCVMPLVSPCRSIVTIHDLNFAAFGESMPPRRRLALRTFVHASARLADRVIAVSEFTRGELERELAVPSSKIRVVYEATFPPGPPREGAEPASLPPRPYFVAFSSTSPHKNIARLIDAHALARKALGLRHQLVVIGHLPDHGPIQPREGVTFLGYIPEEAVDAVLRGADGLVFPSRYEGFGLPLLEAMVRGVPVACSRAGALPEIAADAAVCFDPNDETEMGEALRQLSDPGVSARLRAAGFRRVAQFSWEKAARETLQVCEELAGQR